MDLEKNDWRVFEFDENSELITLGKDDTMYSCTRAVHGLAVCCCSICHKCYNKASSEKSGRPSRCKDTEAKSPNSLKHKTCCHSLHELEREVEPHWCDPNRENDGLFTYNWLIRGKGCVGCNKMFVLKRKNMKIGKLGKDIRDLYPDLNNYVLKQRIEDQAKEAKAKAAAKASATNEVRSLDMDKE